MNDSALPTPTRPRVDADREAGLRDAGRVLLNAIYNVLRTLKHQKTASADLAEALATLEKQSTSVQDRYGPIDLHIVRRSLYLNSVRLRNDIESFAAFDATLKLLQEAGIGILFVDGVVDARGWRVVLGQLLRSAASESSANRAAALSQAFTSRNVLNVQVAARLAGASGIPDETQRRQEAKRTYEESVAVSKALFTGTRMGRSADVKKVKKAVQGIVDQVLSNEASMGGLSTLKDYDDYSFTHSVNVCIFCVAIGRRLGLSKRQLYDLGLAALVHDVGMSRIPVGILTKGEGLSSDEFLQVQTHPWLGALSAFHLRDYGEIPYRSMIVAYEHHMKVDQSGYPKPQRPRTMSVFSKIVAVAAAFDAATNTRSYTEARDPGEVLRELWEDKSLGYDPVIVKALINLLGIYPIGTVVILDTYELALVHKPSEDPANVHRPIIRLLCATDGTWIEPPPLVDLAATNAEGVFERTIIKVTKADKYGINASDYFV
jgi:HD-GYP domain-containing protein (c-di-GMP phosphodiesterase class II)